MSITMEQLCSQASDPFLKNLSGGGGRPIGRPKKEKMEDSKASHPSQSAAADAAAE